MSMTRMDDFGYPVPMSVKPFAEGMRRALADVWRGKNAEEVKEVVVSLPKKKGERKKETLTPISSFGGLCRYMMLERAVEDVAVRLRIMDYLATFPEARNIVLPPVIIVTGLPGSGTAEIRDLLSLHPSLKVPTTWELASPVMPKSKQDLNAGLGSHGKKVKVGGKRVDPRHRRVMQFVDWAGKYVPEMRSGGVLGMEGLGYMATGYFDAIFPELHTYGTFPMPTLHDHTMQPESITRSLTLLKDLLKTLLHQDLTIASPQQHTSQDSPPSSPSSSTPPLLPSAIVLEGPHHLPHLSLLAQAFGADQTTIVWVHRDPVSCAVAEMRRTEVARSCFMKPVLVESGGRSSSYLDNRAGSKGTLEAMKKVLGKALTQRETLIKERKGPAFVDVSASQVFADPAQTLVKDLLGKRLGVAANSRDLGMGAVSSIESAAAAAAVGWKEKIGKGDLGGVLKRFGVEEEEVRQGGFAEYAGKFKVASEWEVKKKV
ncbi:hypothetical protein HDU67_004976 [Dinochytrium kinnereticum]|nr:hypothetical protein HDU67_004976 [Dinochytrium kinnereticum]